MTDKNISRLEAAPANTPHNTGFTISGEMIQDNGIVFLMYPLTLALGGEGNKSKILPGPPFSKEGIKR